MATKAIGERFRTARVPRACHHRYAEDCNGWIEPGEQYRETKTIPDDEFWPGQWLTWRSCIRCLVALGALPATLEDPNGE